MKKVSDAVIRRLPKYYRYLIELEREGVTKISSGELSEKMGLNASQIRQDFNCFGGFGQQGFGYHVEVLKNEIQSILNLDKKHNCIIVGMGNIGQALAGYANFMNEGFHIIATFDVNEQLVGTTVNGCKILALDEMERFVQENVVEIGIICTPEAHAMEVVERTRRCGIRAIWNFAPIDIQLEGVTVENVHLSDSLYTLSYRLNEQKNDEE
ncbi:MAG: redox-sensing transcriptional repressor Rex [Christensenellales bacterium]|jgi:redox-sensing transcriptional repressor